MKTVISKLVDAASIAVSAIIGGVMPVVALAILLSAQASAGDVWRVGDLLVATNNGQYKFVRVTGSGGSATFQVVDTLNDGTSNFTAGCSFDSDLRPHAVGFARSLAPSLLERYQMNDIGVPHPVIVSTDTSSAGLAGLTGKSIALDAQGSIYVAHSAGTGEIDQYIPPAPGAPLVNGKLGFAPGTQFPVGANVDVAGSEWLDVTSVAAATPSQLNPYVGYTNSIYYTSAGPNIYLLSFLTNPSNSPLPTSPGTIQKLTINLLKFNPPKGFAYHGIKILADASGNPTGLVVAAGPKVVLFSVSGTTATLSTVYDYSKSSKNTNWESVSLEPNGGFWVTDRGNQNLAHFPVMFSAAGTFITAVPDTTLAVGTMIGTPSGICVDGSFSPGQPKLQPALTATLTPTTPPVTLNVPIVDPSIFPTQTSPNTFTLGAKFTKSNASVSAKLFFVDFDPTNNAGVSDDGFACLKTVPPPPLGVSSPYCETYKLELTPSLGATNAGYSFVDLDIFLLQQTTSPLATPPSTPSNQPIGLNPKFYHDKHPGTPPNVDQTVAILQDETRIKSGTGGGGSTVFTIQSQTADEAVSCGYLSPVGPFSPGSPPAGPFPHTKTIDFKFQAALQQGGTIDCKNGPFVTVPDLHPVLTLVRLNPANPDSSTQYPVQLAGCSNQCGANPDGSADYSVSNSTSAAFELQVKPSNLPPGEYIATTTDRNGKMPQFSALICIDTCTPTP